jgi:NAD+ diphosphatase
LVDARWFTREEVKAVLAHPTGATLNLELRNTGAQDDPPFRVPSSRAIAGMLIKDWADGKVNYGPEEPLVQKGSL